MSTVTKECNFNEMEVAVAMTEARKRSLSDVSAWLQEEEEQQPEAVQGPNKRSCCSKFEAMERVRLFIVESQLKVLATFLKEEREVLKSTDEQAIAEFYQKKENDSDLVAEWRRNGGGIYAAMREKNRRLAEMEAMFGKWESHFLSDAATSEDSN